MEHRTRHTPHQAHSDAETFVGLALAVAISAIGAYVLLSFF